MSPVWMQYDEPSAQRPFEHKPEQHCVLDVQVLLAVVQPPATIGWHVPPVQLPVQHAFPATGHAAPVVKHCVPPHCPEMQAPLQQSVLPTQAAVAGAQRERDEPQVPVVGSQIPEQHEAPKEQDAPNAVQLTLTLPSGPNPPLTVASSPTAPSGLVVELDPSSPPPELLEVPSATVPSSLPGPPSTRFADDASPFPPDPELDPHPTITTASAEKAHQPKRFIIGSLSILGKIPRSSREHTGSREARFPSPGNDLVPSRHSVSRSWYSGGRVLQNASIEARSLL